LKKIKEEHPDVIIGAVTDGRAHAKLMMFTLLGPYHFNFCVSWEEQQGGWQKFFHELNSVESIIDLNWQCQTDWTKKGRMIPFSQKNERWSPQIQIWTGLLIDT
jgi:hypothetical protein